MDEITFTTNWPDSMTYEVRLVLKAQAELDKGKDAIGESNWNYIAFLLGEARRTGILETSLLQGAIDMKEN